MHLQRGFLFVMIAEQRLNDSPSTAMAAHVKPINGIETAHGY
jgi:hypothetical protein